MVERAPKRNIFDRMGLALSALAIACGPAERLIHQPTIPVIGQGRVTAENNGFRLTASCEGEYKAGNLEFESHIDIILATPGTTGDVWVYINRLPSQKMVAVFVKQGEIITIHGFIGPIIFLPNEKYQTDVYSGRAEIEKQIGEFELSVNCRP